MKKRWLSQAFAGVMVLSLMSGCSQGSDGGASTASTDASVAASSASTVADTQTAPPEEEVAVQNIFIDPVYTSDYGSKQEAKEAGAALNLQIAEEGMVLMKNEGDALPLEEGAKVTLFGYASIARAGGAAAGGDASGGRVKLQADLYGGIEEAGFSANPTVKASYEAWLANEEISSDALIAAADLADAQASWEESYAEYGDAAIVVLTDGSSMFQSMTGSTVTSLAYDKEQYDLIDYAASKFDKVIVMINSSKPHEIMQIKNNAKVSAVLLISEPGDNGFLAVGEILAGKVNPSGRTSDTWAADFTKEPSYANFNQTGDPNEGYSRYTVNGEETNTYFTEYEEGIYVGYRYWETRAHEEGGNWWAQNVVYPFGYGLSYTAFDWEVTPATEAESTIGADDTLVFDVTVTNSGEAAGKEVVQLYYTAPYGDETTNETKIEKSYVVLGDFVKTGVIEPGASETVQVRIDVSDMASYDYVTDKTFVLDDGTYNIKISRNAHDVEADFNYVIEEKILCDTSVTGETVTNQLDDITDGFLATSDKQLSRANFAGTMPTRAEDRRELTEEEYEAWSYKVDDQPDDPWYTDEMPVQADAATRPAQAEVLLKDLVGKDFDDPAWETLIDQLTIEEMADLINHGGFHSINLDYIGKPFSFDTDGPKGWTGSGSDTSDPFNQFAAEPLIAGTFNKDLLYDLGVIIGEQGLWGNSTLESGMTFNYTGWYAPGMNIHRSVFDSRYTEYYSEDPYLTGIMAAQASLGIHSKGGYMSMKHFAFHSDGGGVGIAFDDQGNYLISGYRGGGEAESGLSAWFDEQAAREIYLKGYQIAVEEGGADYAMASFTRTGAVTCGANYAINTQILRNEWGFRGAVVTDIVIYGFLYADQLIRGGTDYLLSAGSEQGNIGTAEGFTDYTPTQVQAMRNATKNILYMVANSNAMQKPIGARIIFTTTTVTEEGDTVEFALEEAKAGEAYESGSVNLASINIYGDHTPVTYAVDGLPDGVTYDAETGILSGTPKEAGSYTVSVTASAEGYEDAVKEFALEVK